MGLRSKLTDMSKNYMKDPKSQYFKYLDKILKLSRSSHISKDQVLDHVKKWYKDR